MSGKIISAEVKGLFLRECTILRLVVRENKELCLTIDLTRISLFYRNRIGIQPAVESWDELRQLLTAALDDAKAKKPADATFHIRFTGGDIPTWLAMRIYALCVYEADAIFYAGDCVIKI